MAKSTWEDTGYARSRNSTDRTAQWTLTLCPLVSLVVVFGHLARPGQWTLRTSLPGLDMKGLQSGDAEAAKVEAVFHVTKYIRALAEALPEL